VREAEHVTPLGAGVKTAFAVPPLFYSFHMTLFNYSKFGGCI
jgi:hypothetical protein